MVGQASRIGVVVASSTGDDRDFAPKGRHLRWFLPHGSGFPAKGFRVYRIERDRWDRSAPFRRVDPKKVPGKVTPRWSGQERSTVLTNDLTLVARPPTFVKPSAGGLTISEATGSNVLLRFKRPAMSLMLELELSAGADKHELVAFHQSARVAAAHLDERILIEQPGMTDVLIPSSVKTIRSLSYLLEDDVAAAVEVGQLGAVAAEIDLPGGAADAYDLLSDDVSDGLANRMLTASTMSVVEQRYPTVGVTRLVNAMQSTVNQPHHTITAPGEHGRADIEVPVLKHVQLAALDPNLARMLGLYWVDQAAPGCVYVVVGLHDQGFHPRTYGFAYSNADVPVAAMRDDVSAEQLPGIEYRNRTPMARIGLSWTRPSRRDRIAPRPVFVDVDRVIDARGKRLTATTPHVVNSRSEVCFRDEIDTGLVVRYEVTPIDIFGRSGPSVSSNSLRADDHASPIPPKRVQAVVTQHGYPWQQPASRREPDIRRGKVAATAEFGEAQRLVSPDATSIRWLWRTGAASDNASSPGEWRELATDKLIDPLDGLTKWNVSSRASEVELVITAVRSVATDDSEATTRRLDLALTDANELSPGPNHVGSDLVELLLDHAVLEPGVFDGFRVGPASANLHVIGTHAGIAASADADDHGRTARVVVADPLRVLQAGPTMLRHPDTNGDAAVQSLLRTPTIADHDLGAAPIMRVDVTFDRPIDATAVGGELVIDAAFRTIAPTATVGARLKAAPFDDDGPDVERRTVVARIVALIRDASGSPKTATVVIRTSPNDYLHLRLIELSGSMLDSPVRWYAPYVLPSAAIGLNGERGDIEITMGPTERFTSLFISATTLDSGGVESVSVAPPYEARIVNPPTAVIPARPFPAGSSPAMTEPGAVSFPNRNGDSAVAVEWTPVDDDAGLVRYELGRALDTTIVEADRKRWLRGGDSSHFADHSIVAPDAIPARLVGGAVEGANGRSIIIGVKPDERGDRSRLAHIHGRVSLDHSNEVTPRWLRVVRAVPDGEQVQLVCEPFYDLTADPPQVIPDSRCSVEGTPDYSRALADDDVLRSLADVVETEGERAGEGRNDDAFGIVTGTPTATASHVDSVPGVGRSRYFYKVRTVSPGDARSSWSATSVAFHQLDVVVPTPPEIVDIATVATRRRVTLRRPVEKGLVGVQVKMHDPATGSTATLDFDLDPRSNSPLIAPPFRAAGQLVDLRPGIGTSRFDPSNLVGVFELADVVLADSRDASGADWSRAKNLAGRNPRVLHGMVELQSPPPPGTALAVVTNHLGSDALLEINDRVECEFDVAQPDVETTLVTVKRVERNGRIVSLTSTDVSLGVPQ